MSVSVNALFALALATTTLGCASVNSYERGKLAHPTMQPAYAQSPARAHLRDIQEGARGGTLGVASGCGCN